MLGTMNKIHKNNKYPHKMSQTTRPWIVILIKASKPKINRFEAYKTAL